MFHTPGWVGNLDVLDSPMDKAIDPKVAEGLTAAWRARAVLGLGPELGSRIVTAPRPTTLSTLSRTMAAVSSSMPSPSSCGYWETIISSRP